MKNPRYAGVGYADRFCADGAMTRGQWRREISEEEKMSCCFKDLAPKQGQNASNQAKDIRNIFKQYFNNEGAVPWQFEILDQDGRIDSD